jgi:hypothetical protein
MLSFRSIEPLQARSASMINDLLRSIMIPADSVNRLVVVQFGSRGHYANKEKFLAFARNDKQSSGRVISNKVRDPSELNTTKRLHAWTLQSDMQ